MSAEELAAQDSAPLTHLRAAWEVLCLDVVPFAVPEDAFDAKVLPGLLACFTQDRLVAADAALSTIRTTNDVADIDSLLWTACAGEGDEMAALLGTLPDGDTTNEVLEEMFNMTGDC